MMTMEKAQRIIEAVFAGSQRNCRVRPTVIAGLLPTGLATDALAADSAAGQRIFKAQCGICHVAAAGKNRIGPTLFGVVGRPAGSVPGFNYTADHKKLGVTLGRLPLSTSTSPSAMVPGTPMVYAGLKNDAERADLVAYLETLH